MKQKMSKQKKPKTAAPLHHENLVRWISALVLFVFLILYLVLAMLTTEASRWKLNVNVQATAYVFSAMVAILIGILIYELVSIFAIKGWWNQVLIILLNLGLFVFPFFDANINFPIYKYWKINNWFIWWQSLIYFLVYFFGLMIIGAFSNKNSVTVGLIIAAFGLLIVFAMKGFSNVALTETTDAENFVKPYYGFNTLIWIWGIVILSDSFSYFGGRRFGKHQLAPKISPKKTWEGSLIGGGVAFISGALFSTLIFYLLPNHDYGPFEVPFKSLVVNGHSVLPGVFLVLLSLVFTIWSQWGDLLFSALKRYQKVKDFSKLIPGHGGLLDRLDSFIFTFFLVFVITTFV